MDDRHGPSVDGYRWYRWAAVVRARADVVCTTKLVAAALADHADNESGCCFPSQWRIAVECGYPEPALRAGEKPPAPPRAVQKAIAELKRVGALEVDAGKGRRTSRYRLVPEGEWQEIARTHVRPNEGPARTGGQGSAAQACDSAPHAATTQRRTEVRPELLSGTAQATPDRAAALLLSQPHQPTTTPSTNEEEKTCVPGVVDEKVEIEVRPEAPIVLTGVWAEKAKRYAAERAEARCREQEAQVA
jgi:hypothetical protein